MGVSFIGIATKETNKEKIISSLVDTFKKFNRNYNVTFESEKSFDEIINRKPDNDTLDIYVSDNGTLLTMSNEFFREYLNKETLSENFDFIYFDISDTSNSYRFAMFGSGKEGLCMNIWDLGNSTKRIAGDNFLNITNDEDVFSHSFPNAVDQYLPATFHSIDLSTKIERYKFCLVLTNASSDTEKTDTNLITKKKTLWQRLIR